jgi:hypothetical protein
MAIEHLFEYLYESFGQPVNKVLTAFKLAVHVEQDAVHNLMPERLLPLRFGKLGNAVKAGGGSNNGAMRVVNLRESTFAECACTT